MGAEFPRHPAAMGTWFYRYDPAGNLIAQVDARGWAVNAYYDPLNRLKGKTYTPNVPDGASYNPPPDPGPSGYAVGFAYDEPGYGASLGRKTRAWTAEGIQQTWAYDLRGRVTTATLTIDGQPFLQAFAYDAMDRLTGMSGPVSGTWTLDAGGRWLQRTEGAQAWVYDYGDPAPPSAPPGPYRVYLPLVAKSPTVRCLDEAWHAAWAGSDRGRSWRLVSVSDGTTLGYDGNGNVLTRTVGGAEWRYGYDPENRLTEAWRGAERVASFRYDAEGNRGSGRWLASAP